MDGLYVAFAAQGKGVGSALLEKVQSRFSSTGALKCLQQNQAAMDFYLKHGWRREAVGESEQGKYVLMHFPLATRTSGTGRR